MNLQKIKLSKDQIILRIVLLIPVLLLLIGPILLVPTGHALVPCAFYDWTGLSCPGCGLTRSFHATSILNFEKAFGFHLLGPVFMLGLILISFKLLFEVIWKRKLDFSFLQVNKRFIIYSIGLFWIGFWIYRMSIESGILN
jgi:hypothetical protein